MDTKQVDQARTKSFILLELNVYTPYIRQREKQTLDCNNQKLKKIP
jgi:hypothetical protein